MKQLLSGKWRIWGLLLWAVGAAPLLWAAELATNAAAPAGWDLFLVRHAQTVANATKDYSGDNEKKFTPKGQAQMQELLEQLRGCHFDEIICSPKLRTRHTLLPFLKLTGRQAVIWPELGECCWQDDRAAPVSPPGTRGDPIIIPADEAPYFRLRENAPATEEPAATFADGVLQMRQAEQLLKEHYAGSGKSVLLMGHFNVNAFLINQFLGRDPTRHPINVLNAKIAHIRENPDGTYVLLRLNNKPAPVRFGSPGP